MSSGFNRIAFTSERYRSSWENAAPIPISHPPKYPLILPVSLPPPPFSLISLQRTAVVPPAAPRETRQSRRIRCLLQHRWPGCRRLPVCKCVKCISFQKKCCYYISLPMSIRILMLRSASVCSFLAKYGMSDGVKYAAMMYTGEWLSNVSSRMYAVRSSSCCATICLTAAIDGKSPLTGRHFCFVSCNS